MVLIEALHAAESKQSEPA